MAGSLRNSGNCTGQQNESSGQESGGTSISLLANLCRRYDGITQIKVSSDMRHSPCQLKVSLYYKEIEKVPVINCAGKI